MTGHADLLTALLDACRRGLVDHCEAAKLLGIRKADLGDLVAWRMLEVAFWRVYLAAFNHTFPECNAALFRQPARLDAPQETRWPLPSECRLYSAIDAQKLPVSQPHLNAPLSNAAREFAEPRLGDAWEN